MLPHTLEADVPGPPVVYVKADHLAVSVALEREGEPASREGILFAYFQICVVETPVMDD